MKELEPTGRVFQEFTSDELALLRWIKNAMNATSDDAQPRWMIINNFRETAGFKHTVKLKFDITVVK